MRDFPMFTTENGVGSLVLREIPYRGVAYVTIRDASAPIAFLDECVEFCKVVGASTIYASGHEALSMYPFHTSVLQMSGSMDMIPETDASLFPVTEITIARWREIYNEKMKNVDNASYMSEKDGDKLLKEGNGYFVHRDGDLLGIGIAAGDKIACIASCKKGMGKDVFAALTHALMNDRIVLEVASTNRRAISLYESLGFIQTTELSRWYKIF